MENAPRFKTPPGACDCHMHIFDARFPLAEKARRKEADAPVSEYRTLRLVESSRCWVKLSGAYMTSKAGPPLYADVGLLAKALVKRAPERLVWASNRPHDG